MVDDFQRLADIVVGDQDADALSRQIADHLTNVGDGQGVDAGEGFIQQHEGRLARERPGDLAAPPLAARQARGRGVAQVVDAQLFQQTAGLLGNGGLAGVMQLHHRHDVVLDRHAAEDRGLLRQIAQTHAGALVHRLGRDVLAVQPDGAAVRRDQAGDHVETGGLAGPVRPQQARDLATLDMQGDVAHHLPLAERAGDVFDPQAGQARGLGRRGCRGLDHIEG